MSITRRDDENASEIPFSWFGRTLWKFTPLYVELVFLAICLRLIGIVEPFIFQVIIDRILPFQREASLLVVVAIFAAVSLFQLGFEVLSELLGMLTANHVTREFGQRMFEHLFKLPFSYFRKWPVGEIIARISETDAIRAFLVGTTTGVFLDLIFVFIYVAVLLALSVPLTLIILAALPVQISDLPRFRSLPTPPSADAIRCRRSPPIPDGRKHFRRLLRESHKCRRAGCLNGSTRHCVQP